MGREIPQQSTRMHTANLHKNYCYAKQKHHRYKKSKAKSDAPVKSVISGRGQGPKLFATNYGIKILEGSVSHSRCATV